MPPRISLITPSYQQANYLDECLRSVHEQGYPDLEHIVVDGGSSDGSVALLERWSLKLAWWCSEPDGGQSAAINKGLARATGQVFGWLNSDDALLPGSLQRIADAFEQDPTLLVYGGQRVVQATDGSQHSPPLDDAADRDGLFIRPQVNQQSTFFRLDAVRALGGVDERLRYVMDLELWWQLLFAHGCDHLRFEPIPLALFRLHTHSKTSREQQSFVDETAAILHGMCTRSGLHALADVLASAHDLPTGLRGVPVTTAHADLVRRITEHFLLRWHHRVYSERVFLAMRRFLAQCPPDAAILDAGQEQWLATLRKELNVPGWWAFRLRRKWQHLVS